MNTIGNLLTNLRTLLRCVRETLGYALIFLWAIFCPKAVLAAKLLAVESQLAVCKHQIGQRKRRRPRFTASFRLLWVVLSKSLESCPSDATGYSQEMAHHDFPLLLAMEVT